MYPVFDLLNGSRVTAAYASECLAQGVAAIHVTVNNFSTVNPRPSLRDSLNELAACRAHYRSLAQVTRIVERYADFATASAEGKLAVVLGYQNVPGVERDLKTLELHRDLGVRVIQIAHNVRNLYGDGCAEPADAGLSSLGRELVAELNRLGIVIDISHAGERTGREAVELSKHPVTATHANAYAVCANVRNKRDSTLDALKKNGGVIGLCYLTPLVRPGGDRLTHADVAAHVDHVRRRIGIAHIGIGSDFITDQPAERYAEFLRKPEIYGTWPWQFPVADLVDQQRFLSSLGESGLTEKEIRAVARDNSLRVFETTLH
jgi:membrane dipeptidase